jgi:CheY-like chemotaxis protein
MTKILVSKDAELILALQGAAFRRSECSLLIGRTCGEIVRQAGTMRPDVIVLGAGMEDVLAIACCQRLKADRSLRGIPVLLLAEESSRSLGFRAGADEVLSVSAPPERLLAAVRGQLALPERAAERRGVSVKVDFFAGEREGIGYTKDISVGGLFLKSRDPFADGDRLQMIFGLPPSVEGPKIRAGGNVVRTVPAGSGAQLAPGAGIRFDGLSTRDRMDVAAFVEARTEASR